MSNKTTAHEPKFHIVKRTSIPPLNAWLVRIISVLLALVVCAMLTMVLTHENPFSVYGTMIKGAFGTSRRVWNLLQSLAMLLCVSLAITPAFKMRFWNIGGEGQVLVGGLATAACMILLGDKIPNALLIIVMIIASIVAGAVWAVIPAIFKAKYNTNETLFTLMMNYVGIQLVSYFVMYWENPKGSGKIGIINQSTHAGWFPSLGEYEYLLRANPFFQEVCSPGDYHSGLSASSSCKDQDVPVLCCDGNPLLLIKILHISHEKQNSTYMEKLSYNQAEHHLCISSAGHAERTVLFQIEIHQSEFLIAAQHLSCLFYAFSFNRSSSD